MTNTRPFTEAHAIESVDIAMVFENELSPDLQADLLALYRERLSDFQFSQHLDEEEHQTLIFKREGPDGDVSESLHVHGDYCHVVRTDYRGWKFTRDSAIELLLPVIEMAFEGALKLQAAGLGYRDVFINDVLETYAACDLFRRDSRYLPPMAFDGRRTWRQWLTWQLDAFDGSNGKIGASLRVEAKIRSISEELSAHSTEIHHRQTIYGNEDVDPTVEWSPESLRLKLNRAHDANKEILCDLIVPAMIERIGLKEKSK